MLVCISFCAITNIFQRTFLHQDFLTYLILLTASQYSIVFIPFVSPVTYQPKLHSLYPFLYYCPDPGLAPQNIPQWQIDYSECTLLESSRCKKSARWPSFVSLNTWNKSPSWRCPPCSMGAKRNTLIARVKESRAEKLYFFTNLLLSFCLDSSLMIT